MGPPGRLVFTLGLLFLVFSNFCDYSSLYNGTILLIREQDQGMVGKQCARLRIWESGQGNKMIQVTSCSG
jgi:hypothetical protein